MSDTALRLADWLDHHGEKASHADAAAELRRLHAKCEALMADTLEEMDRITEIHRLRALNAELVGLIQQIIDSRDKHFIDNYADGMWRWDERANAALAKVEASK